MTTLALNNLWSYLQRLSLSKSDKEWLANKLVMPAKTTDTDKAEERLSEIYNLLGINPHPLGKVRSVVHPKPPSKKCNAENQSVT